jgi:hypothetical protein
MLKHARYLLVLLAASVSAAIVGVTGIGSHPVSQNTLGFWLLQADGTPLVMVYYHGPAQWHNTEWKVDSQFTNTSVGWAELKCAKAALHIRIDLGAGRAEIQHKSFLLAENNAFLVVHTTNAQQKIIPLGHHKLLKTADHPAAVMLLDSDKTVKKRIENEAGSI